MDDTSVPPLAPDILDAVLAALGAGLETPEAGLAVPGLDAARWLERFPGREAEVWAVVAAVAGYQVELASVRGRGVGEFEAPLLPPGAVLGDFVLGEVLGSGAMGVVHRATQTSLGGRAVALKLLSGYLLSRAPRFFERFRREATLAAVVHHPHLAEVYGFHVVDGWALIAMHLVEGGTLQDALLAAHAEPGYGSGAGHLRRCAELVRDVAGALQAIHAKGLVHRDVKPTNVMLERARRAQGPFEGRAALVDFGLLLEGWEPDPSERGVAPARRDFPGLRRPIAASLFAFLRREVREDRPDWSRALAAETWAHLLLLMQTAEPMGFLLAEIDEVRGSVEAGVDAELVSDGATEGAAATGLAVRLAARRKLRQSCAAACATMADPAAVEFLIGALGRHAEDLELGARLRLGCAHVWNWLACNGDWPTAGCSVEQCSDFVAALRRRVDLVGAWSPMRPGAAVRRWGTWCA